MAMLFSLLVALAVGFLVLAFGLMTLGRLARRPTRASERAGAAGPWLFDRPLIGITGWGETLARLLPVGGWLERLTDHKEIAGLLLQAGWRDPRMSSVVMALRLGAAGLAPVLVALIWSAGLISMGPILGISYLFGAMAAGYLIPYYGLKKLAQARRQRIARQTRTMTQLLILVLDAGLSTRQALALIAHEARSSVADLASELRTALRQIESGGDQGDVLKDMANVLQVDDLATIIDVLRQVDQYGGAVKVPLQEALEWMEEHRRLAVRERVSRLSGHMTIVMVVFFLPALLIFIGGPAFLAVMQALRGAQ